MFDRSMPFCLPMFVGLCGIEAIDAGPTILVDSAEAKLGHVLADLFLR